MSVTTAPRRGAGAVDYRSIGTAGPPIAFLDSRGPTGEVHRGDLYDDALAAAAGLAHHGLSAGDRVLLVMPTGREYLTVLTACLLTGLVPCTVAVPPRPADPDSAGTRHVRAASTAAQCKAVVTDVPLPVAGVAGVVTLTIDDLRNHSALPARALRAPQPDDPHHIQLTSGSTSFPKAVLLTHRNVAAQLGMLIATTDIQPGTDRISTWLPLYHDMGLVQVLVALSTGTALDLMTPIGFVRDPPAWMRHISERRATLTAAPPFAFATTAERQRRRPAKDLDLSRLRQAYVGAEPIPFAVLRGFRDAFSSSGLADDVLLPCYGMAETVLATTLALRHHASDELSFGRVRALRFDRSALDDDCIAARPVAGRPSRTIVSCGSVVDGLTLRIVKGAAELADGQVGTIEVKGDSVMAGYLTADGVDSPAGGWHDTGDVGLMHDGDLYVVGRTKEMLIVRGRNLPPYDVETVIEEHPAVGPGHAVVFSHSTEHRSTESIVAVVESAGGDDEQALRVDVTTSVREVFGLSLSDVVVVRRGGIPRTSSGKRQRAALRSSYIAGLPAR